MTIDATVIMGALIFLTLNLSIPSISLFSSPPSLGQIVVSPNITLETTNQSSVVEPGGAEIGVNQTGGAVINQTILVSSTNVTFAPLDNQTSQTTVAEEKQPPAISPILTAIIVAPFTVSAVLASLGRLDTGRGAMVAGFLVIFIVLFIVNIQPKT